MIPLELYIFRQLEKKKAQAQRLEDQLFKLEVTATDKEENKEIALGTSKLNYLDPRITVAWWVILLAFLYSRSSTVLQHLNPAQVSVN